jgi:hypothetical protein
MTLKDPLEEFNEGCVLKWVQSFYHRPARHARCVMPTGHRGWL